MDQREHEELKDLIDTISTTAKLIGYIVEQKSQRVSISKNTDEGICMAITFLSWPKKRSVILASHNNKPTILEKQSHQEKVNYLNNLLQDL